MDDEMSLSDYCGSLPVRHNGLPMPSHDDCKNQLRQSSESITPAYSPLLQYPPFGIGHRAMMEISRLLGLKTQRVYEVLLRAEEMQGGERKGGK